MDIRRIEQVEVCGPHSLCLRFNDSVCKRVDVLPLLIGPVFQALRDPAFFGRVLLDPEAGTVAWPTAPTWRPRPCTSSRRRPSPRGGRRA